MKHQFDAVKTLLVGFAANYGLRIIGALLIALVGLVAAGYAARAVRRFAERSPRVDKTLVPLLSRLVRYSILAVTLIAVLDKFGVQTASILAFLGAAGLAVGLALKDTIGDVAAGIVILVLRPFNLGDAVNIGGSLGVVDDIDLFQTKLISFEGVPLVLPNSRVRSAEIQNYSRAKTRRIDLIIGIGYGDDIGKAIQTIQTAVATDTRTLKDPAAIVNVDSLGDSSVNLLVRVQCAAADFLTFKMDLTRNIKQRLDAEGISIPFPQRDVHLLRESNAA